MSSSNFFKWHHLRGALVRRVVLRALMFVLAVIVLCLMQMAHEARVIELVSTNGDDCSRDSSSNGEFNLTGILNSASNIARPFFRVSPLPCKRSDNLTKAVIEFLMEKSFLQLDARVLCVGERSAFAVLALRHLGFFNAFGVDRHPFFSLLKRRFVYELDFEDGRFDFVFSEDLDRVSVPALLVLEMERVLRPGGIGAILAPPHRAYSGGESVAAFLKSSDVVHVCRVGASTLMVFKKRAESFASFEGFKLPNHCPSVENNRAYIKHMEPLTDDNNFELSYLPNSMNISSRNKMIYINLGAGEYAKKAVFQMSKPYLSDHRKFEIYIIDHKTSILSSFVMDPGINFVYHPALSGVDTAPVPVVNSDEFLGAPMDEEGFDFVEWFKETVSEGDFVVLMMKAKEVEMKILVEMFASGAICHVDELFLRCSESADCGEVYRSLRRSGVYVHRWVVN